jgi:hypothetical protein
MADRVTLPFKLVTFLREYRDLCRKHGLMVCSDGEEVEVGKANHDLWGVARATVEHFKRDKHRWDEE